jgi:ATP/maltotriose-dependent transcriptional regulator MalT/DNA-binding SARP family transcriptional activator
MYRDWIRSVFERVGSPLRIVFDGLDRLLIEAASFQMLQVILEERSPDIHLLMLSRSLPPLEIQRLRLDRELAILTNDQLAFTTEEIENFFGAVHGVTLSSQQVHKIHELTGGWAGGLSFLSNLIDKWPDNSWEASIPDHFAESFKQAAFHYLGEEIFAAQSKAVRDFLIRSSIFETIDPGYLHDLMGQKETAIIEELARKNLFVQSMHDEQRGTLFRYHQLFRDFLRAKLEVEVDREQRRSWFHEIAVLGERNGEFEQAIECYLEAESYPEAARVIEWIGTDLLKSGRTGELSNWLRRLPEELMESSPWLLYDLSMARRFTGAKENLETLQRVLALFEQRKDGRGQLLSLAYLIEAAVFKGHYTIRVESLLEKAETLLHSMGSDEHSHERAILWSMVGFGYRRATGNVRKGFWACRNAFLLAQNLKNPTLEIDALANALQDLSFLGEFARAGEILDQLEKAMNECRHPELRAIYLLHSSAFFTFMGKTDEARERIESAQAEVEAHGLVYLYPIALVHKLFTTVYQTEDHGEAEHIGAQLLGLVSAMGNTVIKGVTLTFLGFTAYRKGDFHRARALLQEARSGFSLPEGRSDYHLHAVNIAMGLLCHHLEDQQSEAELDDALDYFQRLGCDLFLVDVYFTKAFLNQAQGRRGEAARCLQVGFEIAERNGYDHFIVLSPGDVVKACSLALELQVEGAIHYARHLLTGKYHALARPDMVRLSTHSNGALRRTALDILKRIHRSSLPRLCIMTLGDFSVLRGETAIAPEEWEGNQPKRLLKAIVARGSRNVPKDVLIEDLWSDCRPPAGERSFQINLHRLRKALGSVAHKNSACPYVHLKGNLVSLDAELCLVDADELVDLYLKGRQESAKGNDKIALAYFEKAAEHYGGDFLPEELYSEWADHKRETLRRHSLRLFSAMAELYDKQRSSTEAVACYQKMIQLDPLSEEAYQSLMSHYVGLHMHSAAIRTFEECKKVLGKELGIEPSQATLTIAAKAAMVCRSPRKRRGSLSAHPCNTDE